MEHAHKASQFHKKKISKKTGLVEFQKFDQNIDKKI